MNKNRKFLMPLAALASVFVTSNVSANVTSNESKLSPAIEQSQSREVTANSSEVFKFILKTSNQSQLMSYHTSHSSHSSHSSHASHSSHQSGY